MIPVKPKDELIWGQVYASCLISCGWRWACSPSSRPHRSTGEGQLTVSSWHKSSSLCAPQPISTMVHYLSLVSPLPSPISPLLCPRQNFCHFCPTFSSLCKCHSLCLKCPLPFLCLQIFFLCLKNLSFAIQLHLFWKFHPYFCRHCSSSLSSHSPSCLLPF